MKVVYISAFYVRQVILICDLKSSFPAVKNVTKIVEGN